MGYMDNDGYLYKHLKKVMGKVFDYYKPRAEEAGLGIEECHDIVLYELVSRWASMIPILNSDEDMYLWGPTLDTVILNENLAFVIKCPYESDFTKLFSFYPLKIDPNGNFPEEMRDSIVAVTSYFKITD